MVPHGTPQGPVKPPLPQMGPCGGMLSRAALAPEPTRLGGRLRGPLMVPLGTPQGPVAPPLPRMGPHSGMLPRAALALAPARLGRLSRGPLVVPPWDPTRTREAPCRMWGRTAACSRMSLSRSRLPAWAGVRGGPSWCPHGTPQGPVKPPPPQMGPRGGMLLRATLVLAPARLGRLSRGPRMVLPWDPTRTREAPCRRWGRTAACSRVSLSRSRPPAWAGVRGAPRGAPMGPHGGPYSPLPQVGPHSGVLSRAALALTPARLGRLSPGPLMVPRGTPRGPVRQIYVHVGPRSGVLPRAALALMSLGRLSRGPL